MDCDDAVFKLQLITLFDSLSFGLIYAFLSPYMLVLGGDHVTVGFLAVTTLVAQLLSSHSVRDLINFQGRRAALYTILNISAVCHALLFVTSSCWFTILVRCIFAAVNQTNTILKSMLLNTISEDEKQFQIMIFNILSSSGYLIGPIITGCLFSVSFAISCFLACCLTIVNICILLVLPQNEEQDRPSEGSDVTILKRTAQSIKDSTVTLLESDYKSNWDIIAVKYLFTASTTIFFSKFTQILKHNFQADSVAIGYTIAYTNALMFIAIYFSFKFREKVINVPRILVINFAFAVMSVCVLVACYSPIFLCYALMCIPIVFARTLIIDLWDDFVANRENENLKKLGDPVSISAGMTVPLLFGILCNQIHHHAVIIFSVLPLVGSLIIINRYSSTVSHRKSE